MAAEAEAEDHSPLIERARDMLYRVQVGPPRRVEYISRAVLPLTGYTPEEHYADPGLFWRIVHADDRAALDRIAERPARRLVVRVLHRSGETRWHEHHYRVIGDAAGAPATIEGIVFDITERLRQDRARRQLQAEWELQRERERIAQELHGAIIQDLYSVGLRLQAWLGRAAGQDGGETSETVEWAIGRLNAVIGNVRAGLEELRPVGYAGDLRTALAHLVDDLRSTAFVDVRLDVRPGLPPIPHERQLALFHIAQEALRNVRMHARATRVEVSLGPVTGGVALDVGDDGVGFDPPTAGDEAVGLVAMRLEAAEFGGTLLVESAPGAGTTVRATLPVPAPVAPTP